VLYQTRPRAPFGGAHKKRKEKKRKKKKKDGLVGAV
jgi:hypothetical protein